MRLLSHRRCSNPADPNVLIDDALAIFYRVPLSAIAKQTIKEQILLTNQTQDYYWTNAWNAYIVNPTDQASFNIVNTRLKNLIPIPDEFIGIPIILEPFDY